MPTIEIRGLEEFRGEISQFRQDLMSKIKESLGDIGDLVISDMQGEVPNATGTLKESVTKTVEQDSVTIEPTAEYAAAVENGRRGGQTPPPISAIQTWLAAKGIEGNARALARMIGNRGIEPNKFIERTIEKSQDGILDIAVEKIQEALQVFV